VGCTWKLYSPTQTGIPQHTLQKRGSPTDISEGGAGVARGGTDVKPGLAEGYGVFFSLSKIKTGIDFSRCLRTMDRPASENLFFTVCRLQVPSIDFSVCILLGPSFWKYF